MRCYFLVSACVLAAAVTTTPSLANAFTMKTRPRHVHVYFLPSELPEEQDLPATSSSSSSSSISSTYVVIDVIRATTTMVHALSNGVGTLIPCGTIEEAYKVKDFYSTKMEEVLLGGERQGVQIEGFDLSNSPKDYARDKVNGRVVGFTTTNGTKALMKCNKSKNGGSTTSKIYIGAFCNLSAVARKILDDDENSDDGGPIHIVCAGSDGQVCGEDVLFAGALCEQLMLRQKNDEKRGSEESLSSSPFFFFEDSARIAMYQWKEETGGYGYPVVHDRSVQEGGSGDEDKQNLEGRLKQALRQTKGGRGLVALGPTYEDDIDMVAQIDTHDLVGVYQKQNQPQEKESPREDQNSSSGDDYRPSIIVAI